MSSSRTCAPALLVLVSAGSVAACTADATAGGGWVGSIDTTGDTVVVTTTVSPSAPWPPIYRPDRAVLVWASERLNRPTHVRVLDGGRLLVADGTRLFLVTVDGHALDSVGRNGRGPGEFERIDGVGVLPGDTVVVWDGRLRRLTWLTAGRRVARMRQVTPPSRFESPRRIDLHFTLGGVMLPFAQGMVRGGGPSDTVVLSWVTEADDSVTTFGKVTDVAWIDAGGFLGPRYPFGPRALYAVSPSGLVAYADGVEYCIAVVPPPGRRIRAKRVCRDWQPVTVGAADRPPAGVSDQELGAIGPMLRKLLAVQSFGHHRNSIDEIAFDTQDYLWVRVVDSTHRVHPFYEYHLLRLRPAQYTWEVFDPNGKLVGRVSLPSRFRPLDFASGVAYGLVENDDGELSVGRVSLPLFPGRP